MNNSSALIELIELVDSNSSIQTQIIKKILTENRKFLPFFIDGQQVFVFLWRGKLRVLSEENIFIALSIIIPIVVYGGRQLVYRIKLRRAAQLKIKKKKFKNKLKTLIKQINVVGGTNEDDESSSKALSLRKETNLIDFPQEAITVPHDAVKERIVHFEQPLDVIFEEHQDLAQLLKVPELIRPYVVYLRDMVTQCLLPNKIYKIVNHQLASLIQQMVKFKKNNGLQIVSYDIFVLALIHSVKPNYEFQFGFVGNGLSSIIKKHVAIYGPIFVSTISMIMFTYGLPLNLSISALFIRTSGSIFGSYQLLNFSQFMRRRVLIDCLDFVQELSSVKFKQQSDGLVQYQENSFETSTQTPYMRTEATNNDVFVSTYPDSEDVFFQKDIVHNSCDVDGQYESLKTQYKTTDDVEKFNSRVDQSSADAVIRAVARRQLRSLVIERIFDMMLEFE